MALKLNPGVEAVQGTRTCVVTIGGKKGEAWLIHEGTQRNRVVFITDPDQQPRHVLKTQCSRIKWVPGASTSPWGTVAAGKQYSRTATLTENVKELGLRKGDTVVITNEGTRQVRIAAEGLEERPSLRVPRGFVTGVNKNVKGGLGRYGHSGRVPDWRRGS